MARVERISRIAVRGFKSIRDEQCIEIRPLTVLAGANSSGKSSIMQPLLLMKQTLEAPADPGALLLDGPHVRFTSAEQLLNRAAGTKSAPSFAFRLERSNGESLETAFRAKQGEGFEIEQMSYTSGKKTLDIRPGMSHEQILGFLPKHLKNLAKLFDEDEVKPHKWSVVRNRCSLDFALISPGVGRRITRFPGEVSPSEEFVPQIQAAIHLPGLRGNPLRTYPKTAAGPRFPGTFESYVAGIISQWQAEKSRNLETLGRTLEDMGLSWKVTAKAVDDTQVGIRVGRLVHSKRGGATDLVSIADVGFGLSQSLPVLVALVVARPGQLVYIEQPEIHLHPKAQRRLAHALCETAKRGALLVIETHSSILLREIQTLVASGRIPREDVGLHWFQRDENGVTAVSTADLDENGAYGDWPVDFDSTELEAEQAYLDAVEAR